jgi:hypothetical protein
MCAASTSLATSCIKRRDNADDAPRALTHCAIACALGCDYGLAVGWLDGLHQVETLVSPPETYAKTTRLSNGDQVHRLAAVYGNRVIVC